MQWAGSCMKASCTEERAEFQQQHLTHTFARLINNVKKMLALI